jgi:chromosome segregation ATPase
MSRAIFIYMAGVLLVALPGVAFAQGSLAIDAEKAKLTAQSAEFQALGAEIKAQAQSLEAKKQRLSQAAANMERDSRQLEQDGRELSKKAEQLKVDHATLERDQSALQPSVQQLTGRQRGLDQKRDALNARRPRVREYDLAAFNREVEAYNRELTQFNAEKRQVLDSLKSIEERAKRHNDLLDVQERLAKAWNARRERLVKESRDHVVNEGNFNREVETFKARQEDYGLKSNRLRDNQRELDASIAAYNQRVRSREGATVPGKGGGVEGYGYDNELKKGPGRAGPQKSNLQQFKEEIATQPIPITGKP